jgi:hypothetical protein
VYGRLLNGRITRWIILLEEYGQKFVHIAGKHNIGADALSRLEKDDDKKLSETEEGLVMALVGCYRLPHYQKKCGSC